MHVSINSTLNENETSLKQQVTSLSWLL